MMENVSSLLCVFVSVCLFDFLCYVDAIYTFFLFVENLNRYRRYYTDLRVDMCYACCVVEFVVPYL